jgi:hypothetical protein
MSGPLSGSNVYYLPAPSVMAAVPVPRPPSRARRLRNLWWHLRLTLSALRAVVIRPRPIADDAAYLDGAAEMIERRRPQRREPAIVIDFAVARDRRRPARET